MSKLTTTQHAVRKSETCFVKKWARGRIKNREKKREEDPRKYVVAANQSLLLDQHPILWATMAFFVSVDNGTTKKVKRLIRVLDTDQNSTRHFSKRRQKRFRGLFLRQQKKSAPPTLRKSLDLPFCTEFLQQREKTFDLAPEINDFRSVSRCPRAVYKTAAENTDCTERERGIDFWRGS